MCFVSYIVHNAAAKPVLGFVQCIDLSRIPLKRNGDSEF